MHARLAVRNEFTARLRFFLLLATAFLLCSCAPRFASRENYVESRKAALGVTQVTPGPSAMLGEAEAQWMALALPNGKTGHELLHSRLDGYLVVEPKGDAAPGYEGPKRSELGVSEEIPPPAAFSPTFLVVFALVLVVVVVASMRSKMVKAIALRILFSLLSLLFITFVASIADEVAPGNAATVRAGEKANLEQIRRLEHNMGLDRPWIVRYGETLGYLAQGDFGRSYYGPREPVTDIIKRDLPMTMRLALAAVLLSAGVGIIFGTLAAVYQNRFADRSVLTLGTLGVTIPNFVLGPLLVYAFADQGLDLVPSSWSTTRVAPDIYYLILPIIVLAARPAAMLTRLTRASMIETMQQEFVRLAVAKGVPFWRMVTKHALRNAILPVVTAIGTSFGFLLTGSFVTERFFLLPGLGREAIEAILQTNAPVVQGTIIVTGIMFIVVNLIVDLLLPILDPRIREAQV